MGRNSIPLLPPKNFQPLVNRGFIGRIFEEVKEEVKEEEIKMMGESPGDEPPLLIAQSSPKNFKQIRPATKGYRSSPMTKHVQITDDKKEERIFNFGVQDEDEMRDNVKKIYIQSDNLYEDE